MLMNEMKGIVRNMVHVFISSVKIRIVGDLRSLCGRALPVI